jgi:hypothetical protein
VSPVSLRRSLCCLALTMPMMATGAIPDEYVAAVNRATEIGARIHLHDWAASGATDVLVERRIIENDGRLRGWLTDEFESGGEIGVLVTFFGEVDGRSMGLYQVRMSPRGEPTFEKFDAGVGLDESQLARLHARSEAKRLLLERQDLCGESYNTVVLPPVPATGDHILVYMLAATSRPGVMIAGGHHLYEYSADGTQLLSDRAFTRACFELPMAEDESRGKVEAITLTHLLDPAPTEIHVFLNRSYGQTILLGTTSNSLLWVLKDGEIISGESFDAKPAKKKKR